MWRSWKIIRSNAGRRVVNANQLALMSVNKMSSQNTKNWNVTPSKFTFLCLKELRRASLPCELIRKASNSLSLLVFSLNKSFHRMRRKDNPAPPLLFCTSSNIKLLHLTELEGASMSVARNHLSPAHCASLKSALQAVKSAFLFFLFCVSAAIYIHSISLTVTCAWVFCSNKSHFLFCPPNVFCTTKTLTVCVWGHESVGRP